MNETAVPAPATDDPEDLGFSGRPLCREPWESFYILRRGVLPCCHGNQAIAPMADWNAAWNSPQIQEIRDYLKRGKLSPYCLDSLGCPIVQRYLRAANAEKGAEPAAPRRRSRVVRTVNRLLFGLPRRIYRALRERRTRRKYS